VLDRDNGENSELPELSFLDHTRVIRSVMDQPLQVSNDLRKLGKNQRRSKLSAKEILSTIAQRKTIDAPTRDAARRMSQLLPLMKRAEKRVAPSTLKLVHSINKEIDKCESLTEMMQLLNKLLKDRRIVNSNNGLREGIETGINILKDGLTTIYSPEFGFYKLVSQKPSTGGAASRGFWGRLWDTAVSVGKKDVSGAIAGGATGAVAGGAVGSTAGGVGAGPGALAGAGSGAVIGGTATSLEECVDLILN
jgi:hypothetical protein